MFENQSAPSIFVLLLSEMNRKPSLIAIFMTIFIDLIGFGIVIPLLPFYALNYQASALEVTLLSTVFSLMQFIFAPFWGSLSDRFGRRPILLFSIVGNLVSYTVFAFAGSLWVLFLSRIMAGTFSANFGAAQAYIADITTQENRSKGMGLVGAAFGLGFIFGPAIGGVLSPYGFEVPGLAAVGLCVVNLFFAWFFLPESYPKEAREKAPRQKTAKPGPLTLFRNVLILKTDRKHTFTLIMFFFLTVLAHAVYESTFALLMATQMKFDARQVGYLFTLVGVTTAIIQGGLIGKLTQYFGSRKLIVTGLLLASAALVILPLNTAGSLSLLITVTVLYALGLALFSPSANALISTSAGEHEQGKVMGISQGFASLGRIIGPIWGGLAFGTLGPAAPFHSSAALMILSLALTWWYFSKEPAQVHHPKKESA